MKADAWNDMEITAVRQNYTVTINGAVTNRFTGTRALAGYIGLQCNRSGPVQFRNVRISEIPSVGAPAAPVLASRAAVISPSLPMTTPAPAATPPSSLLLPSMAEVAKQHEDDVFVNGDGPSGTNFGGGNRKLKLSVSLNTKSTQTRRFSVNCYWIAWDGKQHKLLPAGNRGVTLSASSSQRFELVDDTTFGRTDGATRGIISTAGTYRGWVVSVHDASGKKIAGAANIPEFQRLAP